MPLRVHSSRVSNRGVWKYLLSSILFILFKVNYCFWGW